MNKTSKLSRFFSFLWLKAGDTNPTWDSLLNQLMDVGEVTDINEHTITFDNKYVVWIENHPYASGSLYKIKGEYHGTPTGSYSIHCSTKTKIRLEDYVNEHFTDEVTQMLKDDLRKYNESSAV
jgi:hypothetical protein